MSLRPAALFGYDVIEPLPIRVEVSDAPPTFDTGLLPLRRLDERIGLTKQLAAVLDDPRDPELTEHTCREMVRSCVFGILAGSLGPNDTSFQSRIGRHGRAGVPCCPPEVARASSLLLCARDLRAAV